MNLVLYTPIVDSSRALTPLYFKRSSRRPVWPLLVAGQGASRLFRFATALRVIRAPVALARFDFSNGRWWTDGSAFAR